MFIFLFLALENFKKLASKVANLWQFFFSAAPTAQNSPELHFRFINYFIQSSLLRSMVAAGDSENKYLKRYLLCSGTTLGWTTLAVNELQNE